MLSFAETCADFDVTHLAVSLVQRSLYRSILAQETATSLQRPKVPVPWVTTLDSFHFNFFLYPSFPPSLPYHCWLTNHYKYITHTYTPTPTPTPTPTRMHMHTYTHPHNTHIYNVGIKISQNNLYYTTLPIASPFMLVSVTVMSKTACPFRVKHTVALPPSVPL